MSLLAPQDAWLREPEKTTSRGIRPRLVLFQPSIGLVAERFMLAKASFRLGGML
jgi:hypothetical protein